MNKSQINYYYKDMPDKNFFVDIFEVKVNKLGATFEENWHEHLQFFYFIQGSALIRCNYKSIHVKAGDFIIVNSNELHYCESLCDNLIYYIIRVDLSFLFSSQMDSCQTKFMVPLAKNLILFKNLVRNDKEILSCADKIIEEYFSKRLGYELAVKAYIYELIVLLFRKYVEKILTAKQFNCRVNNLNRLKNVFLYINENFTKKITLDEISEMAHISKEHFCRTFKQITGRSLTNYINNLRIQKADLLLQKTDLNITEIALNCGFSDVNYFSRIYKKVKNVSPLNFRKNLCNNL
ncbi:AraC family transcriptional regulator [Clostridium coskatii]|uniref:HTH-type transcriptional activator Btr n=1 Tax=Clostridium coskatii TaxID=1705578 RepID=A0A162L8I8_9CLOT|nr:AraC family transcriptional regulator [Clostridium coskatii]OAA92602.1 HTH-type transcriptional activator Btr [Clostridium coskatii]OBR91531.1 HTH-type transcriptional activator Btr [Clostridium coskatii]